MFDSFFKPKFFSGPQVVLPAAVHVEYRVSSGWRPPPGVTIEQIGNQIITANTPAIASFVEGQYRNMQNSGLQFYRNRYALPGVEVIYTAQFGRQQILLVVTPEKVGGRPRFLPLDDDIIDVIHNFTGWPIPGYDNGVNPTIFGADKPYEFNYAEINAWPDRPEPLPKHLSRPPDPDDLAPTDLAQDQWEQKFWQDCKSGTQIVPGPPLKLRQYWEVEVVLLPDDVPNAQRFMIPDAPNDDGSFTESEQWYENKTYQERRFPKALNTFLSPEIGVIPKEALVKADGGGYKNKSPAVMGLEPVGTPRSAFVTRTSIMQGHIHTHSASMYRLDGDFSKGGINDVVQEMSGRTGTKTFFPGDTTACNGQIFMYIGKDTGDQYGSTTPDPITGPATGPSSGFPTLTKIINPLSTHRTLDSYGFGFMVDPPDPQAGQHIMGGLLLRRDDIQYDLVWVPFLWNGGRWRFIGSSGGQQKSFIGGFGRDTTMFYQGDLTPSGRTYFLVPQNDGTYTPSFAYAAAPGSADTHFVFPPVTLDAGPITPIQADHRYNRMLGDTKLLQDNVSKKPPAFDPDTGDEIVTNKVQPGRYTTLCFGYLHTPDPTLDLGDMQKKDIFRFATHIDVGKGIYNLYVGKNKDWYGPKGKIGHRFQKETPTLVLDEGTYFAAVSWRVGKVHLRIRMDTALIYDMPLGFAPLKATPTLLVPIGGDAQGGDARDGDSTGPHGDGVFN